MTADFFMDASVTKSLDICLPDEIIALMGRELKIDYLSKRSCVMVCKKNDPLFPGTETECTDKNVLRLPDKIKKRLKPQAGELLVCSYSYKSEYLIIKKKGAGYDGDKRQPIKERSKATSAGENSVPDRSISVYKKRDIFAVSSSYPHQFQPEAFKDYAPPTNQKDDLNSRDMLKLCGYVRDVLEANSEDALILIWRFAFGIDCETIRYFSKTKRIVNGVCEAFRFGCKRLLEREAAVSNASLRRVFRVVLSDYEILLLHRKRGISWMSRNRLERDISIGELAKCFRQKVFIALENETTSPRVCHWVKAEKIHRLANFILNLPVEYGILLLLHYYRRYSIRNIEDQLNVSFVKGKIEYLQRVLSDRLGLVDMLLSDNTFAKACALCVDYLKIC